MYVVIAVVYALYKTCIDSNTVGDRQYSSTNDDGSYPSSSPGAGGWNTGNMFFFKNTVLQKVVANNPKTPPPPSCGSLHGLWLFSPIQVGWPLIYALSSR